MPDLAGPEISARRAPLRTRLAATLQCGLALAVIVAVCPVRQALAAPSADNQYLAATSGARTASALRYDADYPMIGYGETATHNAIARLQERMNRGEVRLKYESPRGYLDSVLHALGIDASSQTLLYSKTSLQFDIISAATPRAIYFNDDTYVAWIPGTAFLEIATMDAAMGPVFYSFPNGPDSALQFDRQSSRCLTCHDKFGMAGGGVPQFLFLSTLVDRNGESLSDKPGIDTTDRTPIRDRWAGWYVTGHHGSEVHLGNILVNHGQSAGDIESLRRGNIDSVASFFDTRSFISDKSDIVALLTFEHQAYIQSLITRANYKSRVVLARSGVDNAATADWSSLSPAAQKALRAMLEPLVQAMLFVDAAPITDRITSSSGYDKWFQSQGPRDAQGRSLRELDLRTRLFKNRLSYLVYSEAFDSLPASALEYLYTRFADILSGRDQSPTYSYLSAAERQSILEILTATKPQFAERVQVEINGTS